MKKAFYPLMIVLTGSLAWSCSSDSTSDEFEQVNGKVSEKRMKAISVSSPQDPSESGTIDLAYNADGTLNTVGNGTDTNIFVYDNKRLANITGAGDPFNMEELYGSPHNAFETGQVLEYDDKRNPKKILFLEEEYDFETDKFKTLEYTAEIAYDDTHNPYYFTLEAAGIIDLMNRVQLNFSGNPQKAEIKQALSLFPLNNMTQIVYKNEKKEIVHTININYTYDADKYPTTATVTTFSADSDEEGTVVLAYQYVD